MIWSDETATRIEIDDASHRTLSITHFAGAGTCSMLMPQSEHRESRIDRRTAAELAYVSDHFARHGQLPTSFPRPEYMI